MYILLLVGQIQAESIGKFSVLLLCTSETCIRTSSELMVKPCGNPPLPMLVKWDFGIMPFWLGPMAAYKPKPLSMEYI